jgi:hypothetical protein
MAPPPGIVDQPVNPLGGTMVADPGAFNPYGQPPQGGFGGPQAGGPQAGGAPPAYGAPPPAPGGYGGPPPGGGYGAPDPGAGGFGGPPPGGGYGAPAGGGYGAPAGGGYGAPAGGGYGASPQAQPMGGYGGMPGGGAPMVPMGGGARGPIGKTRNPIMVLVIGSICFVYGIIQIWGMLNELKAFRGKDDINPIMLFVPILNIIMLWGLPAKVLEAKQMAGVPNAQVPHPILYLLLGSYFLPADLNEVWQAAGGGQPR